MRLFIQPTSRFKHPFQDGTCSTEDGQVVYKIVTPSRFKQKAYVYRNIASFPPPAYGSDSDSKTSAPAPSVDLEEDGEKYTQVGAVHFNSFTPTTITIGGQSFTEHELFGKVDVGRFYHDPRTLLGPDGKSYVWDISKQAQLLRADPDERRTEITTYEVRYYPPAQEQVPVLNICPEGEDISDFVVVTWVFAQRLVRMREHGQQQNRRR